LTGVPVSVARGSNFETAFGLRSLASANPFLARERKMSRSLLNIEKRSLLRLMLSGVGLANRLRSTPDAVKALTTANENVLATLGLARRTDPLMQTIARKIIEHAQRGERDPIRLREIVLMGVVTSLRREIVPRAPHAALDQERQAMSARIPRARHAPSTRKVTGAQPGISALLSATGGTKLRHYACRGQARVRA
jgi:hypothetical protein